MQAFPDGSLFEGFFKGGRKHGKGRIITHDGQEILGDWMGGKIKDQPPYKMTNGVVYAGDWKDDH